MCFFNNKNTPNYVLRRTQASELMKDEKRTARAKNESKKKPMQTNCKLLHVQMFIYKIMCFSLFLFVC